jgi:hypothetical protein
VASIASISRRVFLFLAGGFLAVPRSSRAGASPSCAGSAATNGGDRLEAYLTSRLVGSPRIPISAERLVVVLGKDELGHPLEISIDLTRSREDPQRLFVYAIRETLGNLEEWTHWPTLVVRDTGAINTGQLEVVFEDAKTFLEGKDHCNSA